MWTVAGSGALTNVDGTGTSASFYSPIGLAVSNSGTLIVGDMGSKIRGVTITGKTFSLLFHSLFMSFIYLFCFI